jgi:hypothetical protein
VEVRMISSIDLIEPGDLAERRAAAMRQRTFDRGLVLTFVFVAVNLLAVAGWFLWRAVQ